MDNSLYIGPDTAPDRYRLVRSIGRGGEATLYLAEIQLAGGSEPVVVKVLDSKVTLSPEHFAKVSTKWHEQAELLRFVHRPGVVGVREHFEGPPTHRKGTADDAPGRALYLVMNHVDGLDLRDWRAERTLESPAQRREAMRCLEQLADVLDWLHSGKATPSGRTVVHGDLSPGNVMVDDNGQATLVDFGLSKLTAEHQTAEVWFTPGYAAPEVFEGKRSPATDRYAFAAIAYFLLSGESPASTPEQLRAAFQALPHIAGLDEERAGRILSVFAADPLQRPDTLSSWVRDLRFAVVSTTAVPTGTAAGAAAAGDAADAVPPAPALPPLPAAVPGPAVPFPPVPPNADATPPPPAFGPPITASSVPPQQPPATVQPGTGPDAPAGFFPADSPAAAPSDGRAPAGDTSGFDAVPPGVYADQYSPTRADPAPEPVAHLSPRAPQPSGRGRGLKAAAAAVAVLLVAGLTVVGMKALDDDGSSGGSEAGATVTVTETKTQPPAGGGDAADGGAGGQDDAAASPSSDEESTGDGGAGTLTDVDEVGLTTLEPITIDAFDVKVTSINSVEFDDAFVGDGGSFNCGGSMEFNLDRAWSTLEMTAGIVDTSQDQTAQLIITLDGKRLFNEGLVLGKSNEISLDVANGLRLKIEYTDPDNCEPGTVALGSPMLKK